VSGESSWPEVASELNLCLTAQGSDGKYVPLVSGGNDIPVTWSGRQEYINMIMQFNVEESQSIVILCLEVYLPKFLFICYIYLLGLKCSSWYVSKKTNNFKGTA
jgi:hypothetical protein